MYQLSWLKTKSTFYIAILALLLTSTFSFQMKPTYAYAASLGNVTAISTSGLRLH